MSDMLVVDEIEDENNYLAKKAKDVNAHVSDTRLDVSQCTDSRKAVKALIDDDGNAKEMAVTAIPDDGSTEVPESIRARSRDTGIMLVADETLSPAEYLTPDIKASSLLLRPYDDEECESTMKDFILDSYAEDDAAGRKIVLKTRGEKHVIRVSDIYYIEARGTWVFFRLKDHEEGEYTRFEKILKTLGDGFVRCHRSFAFNLDHLKGIRLSDNTIDLTEGLSVPLSRTYKNDMRDLIKTLESKDR